MHISKTDYLLFRECDKNAWMKIHRPEVYKKYPPSDFERLIMKTGNDVDALARELFANGVVIEGRGSQAQQETDYYLEKKQPAIFQAAFEKDGLFAAVDILQYDEASDSYFIFEVKSSNKIKKKIHYYDLAFQVNLLRDCGVNVTKAFLIHLNEEYIRSGELNLVGLFAIDDVTEKIDELLPEVKIEMEKAIDFLTKTDFPTGGCKCIYKGRSSHCTCFREINSTHPEYSVNDITRIGQSKKKLEELIDSGIFDILDVPEDFNLNDRQKNQILTHRLQNNILDKTLIKNELDSLQFPLYFLDYETFPSALPRHDGYAPYHQIPFQYALYVLNTPEAQPQLLEFLHVEKDDPSTYFVQSLRDHIGDTGSVIVWHKQFECSRNTELAKRVPTMEAFLETLNGRVYDLEDIFTKQYYVHKDFKGKTSIKKILPILAPTHSYKDLTIQDGTAATEIWNAMVQEMTDPAEKEKTIKDLKAYCGLDAYAMYAIWRELFNI
jgi:hypothetical protein